MKHYTCVIVNGANEFQYLIEAVATTKAEAKAKATKTAFENDSRDKVACVMCGRASASPRIVKIDTRF
jgi:hypothetical protein